ncbi:MAG: NADH-ubiquinone oxidoreductase subunit 4L [Alphaproteobacteria bacterium BRH_c36]|nr:MAG: NADH-ubiquinone oxidoreductase subunit 4L [Alphaproteobacteria bacterium BRH_c36]
MEGLIASAIGILTASGIYLMLQRRMLAVIVGLSILSYAVNLFLFAMGRLAIDKPPVLQPGVTDYSDPLPQALVLTAIVIAFGMTALIVVLGLRAYLETGSDTVDVADSQMVRDFSPGRPDEKTQSGRGPT